MWKQKLQMRSGILRRGQLAMLMASFGHVITVVAQDVFVSFVTFSTTKPWKHLDCQKSFSAVRFWDRWPLRLDRSVAERIKGSRSKEVRWTPLGMATTFGSAKGPVIFSSVLISWSFLARSCPSPAACDAGMLPLPTPRKEAHCAVGGVSKWSCLLDPHLPSKTAEFTPCRHEHGVESSWTWDLACFLEPTIHLTPVVANYDLIKPKRNRHWFDFQT